MINTITYSKNFIEILKTKPHNEHHLNRYIKFICSLQDVIPIHIKYVTEQHHICPRLNDLFPEYKSFTLHPWNKIVLTRRQHYIAHLMLRKAFPCIKHCFSKLFANSRLCEESREQAVIKQANKIKNKTPEEKLQTVKRAKETISKRTPEQNRRIREINSLAQLRIRDKKSKCVTEWHKNMSAEERDEMNKKTVATKFALNDVIPNSVCPHCGEEFQYSNLGNFNKHHNDNCKHNPNRNVKIHKCDFCNFTTENKSLIVLNHNENCKHNPNYTPKFKCKFCDFEISNKSSIISHERFCVNNPVPPPPSEKFVCEHCKQEVAGKGNMIRWHGDKCKQNPLRNK